MKAIFYLIGAMAVLGHASCTGEKGAGKPRLIADYFVRYLADVAELKAQASFYEGQTLQTATPKAMPGGVTFQQSAMEVKSLGGQVLRYSLQRRSTFNPPFAFGYTNDGGEKEAYTLPLNPVESFSFKGPVSRSKGFTLVFQGAPLGKEESLVLLFSDATNQAATITVQGPQAGNELTIPAGELSKLQNGPGTVYLVRKTALIEDSPTRYIIASGEYYTATMKVDLAP